MKLIWLINKIINKQLRGRSASECALGCGVVLQKIKYISRTFDKCFDGSSCQKMLVRSFVRFSAVFNGNRATCGAATQHLN